MTKLSLSNLSCEYLNNPLGLDQQRPRLAWQITSDAAEFNIFQSAYQVQVSLNDRFTDIFWDSGKSSSGDSWQIEYAGRQLTAKQRYYWRVRIWDQDDNVTAWSETAWWEMGLLSPDNWQAAWIGLRQSENAGQPCPVLRREWECAGSPLRARLYVTARGLYIARINGQRVSEDLFAPGWTKYEERTQYQVYDVTNLVRPGRNVLGAMLAEGWYKGVFGFNGQEAIYGDQLAFLARLELEFTDGSRQVICSDEKWLASVGEIQYSSIYMGEIYDAGMEQKGWSEPDFTPAADKWQQVDIFSFGYSNLVAQENQPVRIIDTIRPVNLFTTPGGDLVADMGQNMVGWLRLRTKGIPGTRIVVEHAEVLDKDGQFFTANLRSARQRNEYILGDDNEYYLQPLFTWQGFRYVRISGYPGTPQPDDITGLVLHTDMPAIGDFSCSDEHINQLQHNIVWGQKGNFLDVPTDCPQRDERLGWTGDAQVFIRTACFNMNVARFFTKWLRDLKAEQSLDKGVPHVVPNILGDERFSSAAWGDAATICPWTLYLCYGDKKLLQEQFDSMKSWVEYIRRQGDNEYLWNTGFHYGDWLGLDAKEGSYVGATATDLIATAFYAYSAELVVKAAQVLGRKADMEKYRDLHSNIVRAFRAEFITPSGRLAVPTQTAHVLVLMFGLAREEDKKRLLADLVRIIEINDNSLTTGFVGTPYLCHVLSQNGRHDLAGKLVMRKEYPSWLYQISKGATTIWEHWDGIKEDGSFWSNDMNSFNHYAYGAIGDWLYRVACGLDTDPGSPAYKHSIIQPKPVNGWTWARAELQTPYGRLASEWQKDGDNWQFKFIIPANTKATIIIDSATAPGFMAEKAMINGQSLADFCGLDGNGGQVDWELAEGVLRLRTGSGSYIVSARGD